MNTSPGHPVTVGIKRLDHGQDLPLPTQATVFSAGVDLLAAITEDVTLQPGERALIPSGLCIELPNGYEAQIRPRSGLALKHGITVLNSPGTIDADYRGEIGVILINFGGEAFTLTRGMRMAQMVIAPVCFLKWRTDDVLKKTERGAGGFGSTGTHQTNDNDV